MRLLKVCLSALCPLPCSLLGGTFVPDETLNTRDSHGIIEHGFAGNRVIDADPCPQAQEMNNAQTSLESGGTPRREGVVGTDAVVAQHFGRARTDEDRPGVSDP